MYTHTHTHTHTQKIQVSLKRNEVDDWCEKRCILLSDYLLCTLISKYTFTYIQIVYYISIYVMHCFESQFEQERTQNAV